MKRTRARVLYDAAIREYRQVLADAPRRPGIHFRIGRVLLARSKSDASNADVQQRRARSAAGFEEELAVDPTNANAAYELGEMNRKAGELEPARKFFAQAVTSYPAFEQALVGLARTLIALGRPAEALPYLQTALKGNPENEVAHYQVAQAYRALGNTAEQEKALAEFNRVRALAAGARQRCPRHCGMSPHKCSTSNLRNDCKGSSRGHRKTLRDLRDRGERRDCPSPRGVRERDVHRSGRCALASDDSPRRLTTSMILHATSSASDPTARTFAVPRWGIVMERGFVERAKATA